MHVFVCYQLTTDLFDHVLYWGLVIYLVPPVTDWWIDGMQMYLNVSVMITVKNGFALGILEVE
jgi:hypothetical protein